MANQSSTSKRKRRKYQLVQDFSYLNVNLLSTLEHDDGTLVERTFTCMTHGGANKLWRHKDTDMFVATVSTAAVGHRKENNSVDLPVYKHYVLTEAGFRWAQKQLITGRLRNHA
jgi:hypothetical protein